VRNRRDRRTINIYPTARGRNLKNELLAHAIRINETAVVGMSAEEIAYVRRILVEMKRNLDREDELGTA
jgi:DNA-binding MarR family transcriptional regulator